MILDHPLWILLSLPVLAILLLRSRGRPRGSRGAAAAAAALLLGLGAAGLLLRRDAPVRKHVLVVDRSASVLPFVSEAELARMIREHASKFSPGDRLGLVFFGEEAIIVHPLVPPDRYATAEFGAYVPPRDGTNPGGALALAASLLPTEGGGEILLVSDGRGNRNPPEGESGDAPGIRVHTAPIGRAPAGDFGIEAFEGPPSVPLGSPVTLTARVVSWSGGEAVIRFFDGRGRLLVEPLERSFLPGETRLVPVRFLPDTSGEPRFTVRVSPRVGRDPFPANDAAETVVRVAGERRVLYIAEQPSGRIFGRLLAGLPGADVTVARPFQLGAHPQLDDFDLVVLDGVGADALGEGRMRVLEAYVKDGGGGVVLLGGQKGFGLGSYFDTPVERLSPVRCDPEEKTSLALVLLLDASGSMAEEVARRREKFDFALVAVLELLKRLRREDFIAVVPFSGRPLLDPALRTVVADEPPTAIWKRLFDHYRPSGTTSIFRALDAARGILEDRGEARKHVLLLSDGMENVQVDPAEYRRLRRAFKEGKVTVSAAVTEANLTPRVRRFFREEIVHRGKMYAVEAFVLLSRDFVEDVTRARGDLVKRGRFSPVAGPTPPGVASPSSPEVHAFIRTGLRVEMARAALTVGEEAHPLLAWWRYGLGRVVAFPSSLEGDWAPAWRSWGRASGKGKGLLAFWETWIRWVSKASNRGRIRVRRTPRGLRVALRAESGEPLPDAMVLTARLLHRGRKVEERAMLQEGPGLYVSEFPRRAPGYYRVAVFEAGKGRALGEGGLYAGSSMEMGALGPDPGALRRLCAGGGRYWEDPSLFLPGAAGARTAGFVDPGWLLCIASALCLVLFAFTGRRGLKVEAGPPRV